MTEQLIDSYNAYLIRRGIVRNSVSFYMRILRAVYNKAVRLRLVEQTYPFHNVYTGVDRTRKRAVDEQLISQLHKLKLSAGSPLALARDPLHFSYCTRGMAFVDVAYLKKFGYSGRYDPLYPAQDRAAALYSGRTRYPVDNRPVRPMPPGHLLTFFRF